MTRWQNVSWLGLLCILAVVGSLSFVSSAPAAQIVFYDFNDASNAAAAADQSGNGNNGTIAVATYTADGGGRTGQAGDRALDFGAFNNGAVLTVPNAATGAFDSLTQNDAATVAFWQFGGAAQPVNQWTFLFDPGRQLGSHAPWGDGTIYFDVAGCCGANQRINKNEPDSTKYKGQWNHYAFVKNGTFTSIYQNGQLFHDSGADAKSPLGAITTVSFGADGGGGGSMNGLLDEVGVWDQALSQAEIQSVMLTGVVPEPSAIALLVIGAFSLGAVAWRRKSS
jgi:hypothetical protein